MPDELNDRDTDRASEPGRSVHRYLLRAHKELGGGWFRPSEWDVKLPRGLSEEQRRLPSLHEAMHAALTDSTAVGMALHVYFWLDRYAPGDHDYRTVLEALFESCRRVQEYFATYASVDILKASIAPSEALAGYPEYGEYFELASRLTTLPGFRLPYHGVKAVTRVCMQSAILDVVERRGLSQFRVADLRVELQPDHRLRELRPILTDDFWRGLLAGWEQTGAAGWDQVAELNRDPDRYGELADGEQDDSLQQFDVFMFEAVSSALERRTGLRTLGYGGHIELAPALIDAAQKLVPDAPVALYADTDAPVSRREEAIRTFGDEQFLLSSSPLVADVSWIDLSNLSNAEPFITGRGTEGAHYFFVVRTREEIASTYELDAEAREWLGAREERYVVAIRSHDKAASGEVRVRLGLIGDLSDIPMLGSLDGNVPFLLGNIAMSIMRLPDFEEMLDRIPTAARLTMLFDMPPLPQFHKWREGLHRIRYSGMTVQAPSPIEHAFVFEHDAMPAAPFIAPCSEQMLKLLLNFAAEEGARYGLLALDESLPELHAVTLMPTVWHLAHEERFFTFRGGLA